MLEGRLVAAATRFWMAVTELQEKRSPGAKKTALRSLEDEVVTAMARYMHATAGRAPTVVASPSDDEATGQGHGRRWSRLVTLDRGRSPNAGMSYPRAAFLDEVANMYGPPDLLEPRRPACGHRGIRQDSQNIRQYFKVASESLGAVPGTNRAGDQGSLSGGS